MVLDGGDKCGTIALRQSVGRAVPDERDTPPSGRDMPVFQEKDREVRKVFVDTRRVLRRERVMKDELRPSLRNAAPASSSRSGRSAVVTVSNPTPPVSLLPSTNDSLASGLGYRRHDALSLLDQTKAPRGLCYPLQIRYPPPCRRYRSAPTNTSVFVAFASVLALDHVDVLAEPRLVRGLCVPLTLDHDQICRSVLRMSRSAAST